MKKIILDISYSKKLTHVGSCLTTAPILCKIYEQNDNPLVILSNGHAGLALYAALEIYKKRDARTLFKKHGVHPNRDTDIFTSTGSLGHGIGIAVGAAITGVEPVHCILSDGEMFEGSVWESLSVAHMISLQNLFIYVNANGYGANSAIDAQHIKRRLSAFDNLNVQFFETKDATQHDHYEVLTQERYKALYETHILP